MTTEHAVTQLLARITELEAKNKALRTKVRRLERRTVTDTLTGLFSRRYFEAQARARECEARRASIKDLFVLFVDVDHFKAINDHYGHQKGDTVLKTIGRRIQQTLRGNDVAARYGGEEIVILGRGNAEVVAQRILCVVASKPIHDLNVTVSIGSAYFDPTCSSDTLLATVDRADRAMYVAKNSGRNRVFVYR